MLSNDYAQIAPSMIMVDREKRQRKNIDVSDLLTSIPHKGILNPIIITPENVLVAGERRLAAAIKLGLHTVPVRYSNTLSETERQLIELEENLKRKDLSWQENSQAVKRIHELYVLQDKTWTQTQTAEAIGITIGYMSQFMTVAAHMDKEIVASASSIESAMNIISRSNERKIADALASITELGAKMFDPKPAPLKPGEPPTPIPAPPKVEESILQGSFLEWAPRYEGRPFNLIHCDFPFGINVFAGKQANTKGEHDYDDKPDLYWELIDCLCENLNRVMSPSAHLVFWFPFDYYTSTLERFRKKAPSLAFQNVPLFWHKSDNIGILPDAKRGPRRIVESAFIASREDRFIIKATSNSYPAPTDKAFHPSTKPEPVLRYFFQMFVDENTRLLDPTCGSGSALRAAESLGANYVFGIERDKEHFEGAQIALKKFRALKRATEK